MTDTRLARATYTLTEPGVYLIEVNYTSGFAAAIEPIVYGAAFSILPNVYDTTPRSMIISSSQAVSRILDAINAIRLEQGLSPVKLDPTLTKLAQYKADDMNTNNYVGHTDSLGETISASARRMGLKLTGRLGENVAGGTVSPLYLQSGLSLSSGHRSNMLGPWSNVGIAVVIV